MTGTRDNDPTPSVSSPVQTITVKAKTSGKTVEEIDGDLGRTWVRMMLGRNRGEIRGYRQYDELLDARLAASK